MATQQLRVELIGSADDLISSFSEASSAAQRVDENLEGLEQAAKQAALGQLEYNEVAEQFVNESGDFISQAEAAGRAQARLNEVGIETTAQIRDQVQEFEALKAAYQDDARAVADLNDRQQQLRNQLAEVGEAAAQQNQDLSRLDERFEQSTVTMTDFASRQQLLQQELQESAQAQRQFASASGSADQAVLALSQGMEDIAFANNFGDAMRFAGNNVTQAAQSFGQARAEAGGLLATLRGVSPAVLGVGAFSALVALGPRLVSFFDDGEQAASSFKDTLSEVSGEVVTLNAAINDTEFEVPAEQLGKYRENLESSLTEQRALVAALEQSTRGLSTLGSEAADAGRSLVNTAFGADFELTQEQALRGAEEAAERLGLEVETVRDAIRGSQSALLEVESTLSEQPAILEDAEERQQVLNQLLEDAETAIQRQQARQEALSAAREEAGAQLEENEDTLEDSAGTTDEIAQAQDRITRAVEQEIIAREEAKALLEDLGTSNDQIARSVAETLGTVENLRTTLADLSGPQGQILARQQQTKQELERQVELQKQLNRLQQEALPEGFQTDSPGANLFQQQQSEQFARNLQAAARAIDQMAARQQTLNNLFPDPSRIEATNLSLREMRQVMGDVTRQFGAGALDVEAFIGQVDQLGEKLRAFGLADTALQSVRAEINQTKRALRTLMEEGADPSSQVVQDLKEKLESLQREAVGLQIVQQAGLQLATSGFTQLGRAIAGADDAMEKFKQTAASTLQTVGQALLSASIAGPLGLPFAALGAGVTVAGGALSLAEGGLVRGPGGTRDDQIPTMLSDQEFVVQAASAQMAPSALQAINEDPALAGMIESLVVERSPQEFTSGDSTGSDDQTSAVPGGLAEMGALVEPYQEGGYVQTG